MQENIITNENIENIDDKTNIDSKITDENQHITVMADDNFDGKICPFCKTKIKIGDKLIICPVCDTPHHQECWEENKGCTTFGCSEQSYEPQDINQLNIYQDNENETINNQELILNTPSDYVDNESIALDGDVSSAIEVYNTNLKKTGKKKKKLKIIIITVLTTVIIIAATTIGGYFYFNNIKNQIVDEIKSSNSNVEKITTEMNSLGYIGTELFQDEISKAFTKVIKNNPYQEASSEYFLVNESEIAKYKKYSSIANAINLKNGDTVDYINAVLSLEKYQKYNRVGKCILAATDNYKLANEYLNDVFDAIDNYEGYQTVMLYLKYAKDSMFSAYLDASGYEDKDELCDKYCNYVYQFYEWLRDLYNNDSPGNLKADKKIRNLVNKITDSIYKVDDIIDNLPKIK